MPAIDTLICARWVVPVEPDPRVLEHHALAFAGGRIAAVLPIDEARRRYPDAKTLERPQHALLPGLVNAQVSASSTLLRGRAENCSLDVALADRVEPLQRRWADPEFVRDGVDLAIAGMLNSGTTCFASSDPMPEVVARRAAERRVRACVGLPVGAAVAPGTADDPAGGDRIDRGMQVRDDYRGDALITTQFTVSDPQQVTAAGWARIVRLANELEIPIAMRVHATAHEVARCLAEHGQRPLARLASHGVLTPLLTALHLTQCAQDDVDTLARAGAAVVHSPAADLKLGAGVCPLASLLGRGIRVALGTQLAAAGTGVDLLGEARTAGLLAAGVSAAPGAVGASDLLQLATLQGARVLGLGEQTGSLVAGKWADVCCIDLRCSGGWPVHDLHAALVYGSTAASVSDVWVAGRQLLQERRLTGFDEEALLARADTWRARLDA